MGRCYLPRADPRVSLCVRCIALRCCYWVASAALFDYLAGEYGVLDCHAIRRRGESIYSEPVVVDAPAQGGEGADDGAGESATE